MIKGRDGSQANVHDCGRDGKMGWMTWMYGLGWDGLDMRWIYDLCMRPQKRKCDFWLGLRFAWIRGGCLHERYCLQSFDIVVECHPSTIIFVRSAPFSRHLLRGLSGSLHCSSRHDLRF